MTRATEHDARVALEQRAQATRDLGCGSDFLRDCDDLAPARPLVWLVLAWAAVIAAVALILLAPAAARAQEVWGVINTVSWHADRTCPVCNDDQLNQANWGAGLEARFEHGLGAAVGLTRNSYGEQSLYVLGLWQPLTTRLGTVELAAGGFAGAVTGYERDTSCDRSVCKALGLMLTAATEAVGVNLIYLPAITPKDTTTFGLQLKVRLV
jgi:hypothetical protein